MLTSDFRLSRWPIGFGGAAIAAARRSSSSACRRRASAASSASRRPAPASAAGDAAEQRDGGCHRCSRARAAVSPPPTGCSESYGAGGASSAPRTAGCLACTLRLVEKEKVRLASLRAAPSGSAAPSFDDSDRTLAGEALVPDLLPPSLALSPASDAVVGLAGFCLRPSE